MLLPSVECPQAQLVNLSSHPTIRMNPSAQNQIPRPHSPRKIHNNILLTGVLHLQNPIIKVQIYNSTITQKIQWEAGWIRRLMAFSGMCMNQELLIHASILCDVARNYALRIWFATL